MADYYYKTLGEARAAIVNAFTSFGQLTYTSLTLSITWVTGSTVNGGHWVVAGDVLFGEQYANGSYWAAEAKTGAGLSIGRVGREPGMGQEARVEQLAAAGAATAEDLRYQLWTSLLAAADDVTDGSAGATVDLNTELVGAGDPVVLRSLQAYSSANDQAVLQTAVVVTNRLPSTSAMSEPIEQAYLVNTAPVVNNRIEQAPQYNIDQGINAGGSVYSVESKQITSI